jgi:hypothetical protein
VKLIRPVPESYPVTQRFGENPAWYPATKGHNGIDYGVPEGTQVVAAAPGQVIRAELDTETAQNPKKGYGYHVRIQHSDGSTAIYGHLSRILVKTGQLVNAGDPIARSGNTGWSTGPHLHFEIRLGASITTSVDPDKYAGYLPAPEVEPDPILTARITRDGAGLRVRSAPSTSSAIVRYLSEADTLNVSGIAGRDAWLKVDDGFIFYDPDWIDLTPAED